MDSEPHVHQAIVARRYGRSGGAWEVTYGDTTITVEQRLYGITHLGVTGTPPVPTSGQIHRALKKAIRRHDKGSRKAVFVSALPAPVVPVKAGQWPSDYLKEVKLGN